MNSPMNNDMLPDIFEQLPDDADVWIYAASSALEPDAAAALERALDELVSAWSSHGRRVLGAHTLLDTRVVIVGAYVPDGTISGCGIDKSLHVLDEVAAEHGFDWADGLSIVYRASADRLAVCSRSEFRERAASGSVDTGTPVIDLSTRRLGDLRSNGIERPAGRTWHARVFDLKTVADGSVAGNDSTRLLSPS
ncbi:MAG: hypothetical protein HKN17_01905 [Rhodothermales bacterium]|nr:hypothetical protein [Rhodothermales bacterium]